MKHTLSYIFICLLSLLPAAPLGAAEKKAVKTVVCTVYPVFLIARDLASGTGLPVSLLLPAELGCPHHYALTPADMARLERATVILANGLGFEPFLGRLAETGFQDRIREVTPASAAHTPEHGDGPNPHLFTTPSGVSAMAERIAGEMTALFPAEAAAFFRSRSDTLRARLATIGNEWEALARRLRGTPVLITHDSLEYIAETFGLEVVGRLEADDGHEHSAHSRLGIEKTIQDRHPRAILADQSVPAEELNALGREHALPVIGLPTLTSGSSDAAPDALEASLRAVASGLEPLTTLPSR